MKKKLPTPHRLPSGTWRCIITIDGVRHSVTGDTPGQTQAKAVAMREGILELQEQRRTFFSLGDAIDEYIQKGVGDLAPCTIHTYGIIRRNRFPDLMARNVWTMTPAMVEQAVKEEKRRVSGKTIVSALGLVQTVLKQYGVDISGIKRPPIKKSRKAYMQPEELDAFFDAAAEDPHCYAIVFAAWSGMRRSEVCGLCWDSVDFAHRTVTIRRKFVPSETGKLTLQEGTKTEGSQRTLPCPDYIMEILRRLRPMNPQPDQRVFSIHPDTLRKAVHRVCKAAGVTDSSVHGLRHTNAAAMRFLGISTHHAMERGGWTTEKTYNETYAYNFRSAMAEENRKVDEFFRRKTEG